MKRIISLLLGIMLLCGVLAAAAEESLPYMEMFKNDQPYKRYTLLTPDSCPAVCITPSSSFMLYDAAIPDDPLFVVFSAPPTNSLCKIFYVDRATYEDLEGDRKIEYGFRSDYWTNEKFLEKVTDPELIVLDGSDGAVAYVSPDYGAAHALVAIDGLDTGDRLEITINMGTYSNIELDERTTRLKTMIQSEIDRVRAEASVVRMDRFWTDGPYRGIRFIPTDYSEFRMTLEMPEMTFHTSGDGEISGKMFVSHFSHNELGCYLVQVPGRSVHLEFTISTWSVYYNDSENAVSYTLSDGSEWGFCIERDVDGNPNKVYGSRVISETEKNTIYLTVRATTCTNHFWWPDMESFISDMETVLKYVSVEGPNDWQAIDAGSMLNPAGTNVNATPSPDNGNIPDSTEVPQSSGSWQETDGKWYWLSADGTKTTGWKEIDNTWYWFAADGAMATGWQEIDGKWYWFTVDGVMAAGWKEIDGKWYRFSEDGVMATGWQEIDGKWYWFSEDGVMATGMQEINGNQEVFSDSGEWLNTQEQQEVRQASPEGGWLEENGAWYYSVNGTPVTGWQMIDSDWYFFDADGRMITGWKEDGNDWYYLLSNGTMAAGWHEIDNTWYFFHGSGKWDALIRTFGPDDPCYTFPGSIVGSMGFKMSDAADPSAAARFSAVLLTDYKVAQTKQADAGKLFEPNPSAHPFFIGTDGSNVNLMIVSGETNQAFFLFYDTQTNSVFSYYENGIDPSAAESTFAVLCPDGYLAIPQETIQAVYE